MANLINLVMIETLNISGSTIELAMQCISRRIGVPQMFPFRVGGGTSDRPDSGQQWPRGFGSAGINMGSLGDLNDVELGALAANQQLVYDPGSGKWINRAWRIDYYGTTCNFTGPADTENVTINAVDTARAFVVMTVGSPPSATVGLVGFVNATTVQFVLNAGSSPQSAVVNFYVIELP